MEIAKNVMGTARCLAVRNTAIVVNVLHNLLRFVKAANIMMIINRREKSCVT